MKKEKKSTCKKLVSRLVSICIILMLVVAEFVMPVMAESEGVGRANEEEARYDTEICYFDKEKWGDINLTNWMSRIPDCIQLSQLVLPGTHDSGMKHGGGVYGAQYTECQYDIIDKQLEKGIRVLDIRLWAKALYIAHGIYLARGDDGKNITLDDVIGWCKDFLSKNPTETVIIRAVYENDPFFLSPDRRKETEDSIKEYYERLKKEQGFAYVAGDTVPTLGEVRGKIVFLTDLYNGDVLTKYEDHYNQPSSNKMKCYKRVLDTSGYINYLDSTDHFIKENLECYSDEDDYHRPEGEPEMKMIYTNVNTYRTKYEAEGPKKAYDAMYETISNYTLHNARHYGWIWMDFPTEEWTKKIIAVNPLITNRDLCMYWGYDASTGTLYMGETETDKHDNYMRRDTRYTGDYSRVPWSAYKTKIKKVVVDEEIHPSYTCGWFNGFTACTEFDLAKLKTDRVYMMDDMFNKCTAVTQLDISSFSNEHVLSARRMFAECESLKTIFANENFDLKNATDADDKSGWTMFHYASSLEGSCGTHYKYGMGRDAAHVDTPENPGLFTSTTKGGLVYYGFSEDGKTMYLNNHKSDKTPNLNVMTVHEGKKVPSWYTSDAKTKVESVFIQNTLFPESLDYWFQGFTDATVFDIDLIDMRVCTSAEHTFEGCTKVETIVLPPSCHTVACSSMFEGCTNLKTIYAPEGCSMVDQTSSTRIFYGCTNLVGGKGTMYDYFYEPNEDYVMAHIDGGSTDKGYFTLKKDIYWGVSNDTLYFSATLQSLTPYYLVDRKYDYSEGIVTPWIDQRTRKTRVFSKVKVLETIQPRHMSYWFYNCIGIEGTLNLSNIDTSLTLDMNYTFSNMGKVKVIDITGFSNASLISANSIFEGGAFGGQEVTTIYASRNFSLEKLQGPLDERGYDPGKFLELDYNLVGGNGTKAIELFRGYRFDGPQAVYARVDVPGQTGLFTLKEDKGQTLYYGIGATRLYISSRLTEKTPAAFTDKMYTEAPWTEMCQVMGIKTVEVLDEISPVYTANWFKDLSAVENFILDKLDTSATVNMDYMFSGCRWCKALDITNFVDVSVKSAKGMFFNSLFETIWVKDFDLRHLPKEDCWGMFGDCINIKGIKGTVYSFEYVDNERALYDGKDGNPGYFSSIKDKKYKIIFTDDYKTTLQEVEVNHGVIPEFTGVLPEKEHTNYIEYVFDGWEPEIVPATEDALYRGVWEPVDRIYAALFEDEGGKLLDYTFFLYGETPTTDVIPEKKGTEEATYKFVSWKNVPTTDEDRQKISGVRGDSIIVYKPVFEEIPKEYTVTFVDEDGTTVLYKENFEYGAMPVYRGSTPSKSPDSEYYYTFEGWEPELAEVTANKTYKAKYTATPWGYVFTKGDGSVYTKGESLGILFEVSGPYRQVVEPEIGTGMKIDEEWYWPSQIGGIDNTWFMMTPDDLNDLSAGEHTITVFYDNGQAPSAKFTVNDLPQPETGVTVKKVDKDGEPLEGAILSIKNGDGNVVHRWETTAQGSVKVNLTPGNYTLIEEVPPAGYKIAEPIAFTVSKAEDGSLQVQKTGDETSSTPGNELVMVDETLPGDLPELDVIFVKKDGEGKRLKDAGLLVKKIGGVNEDKWTWTSSDTEDHVINDLKPGTYVMSEEEVPEGYLPAQSITFRVKTNPDEPTELMLVILSRDEHGDIVETPVAENKIEMIDMPEPLLTVKLSKTDEDGKLLSDASLKVVGVDVNYTSGTWISEDDKDKELSLSPGTYVMSEVLAPEGYLTAQNITFRVTDELELVIVGKDEAETPAEKIVMVDKKKPVKADVTFAKVTEDNILLAGAKLKVEGKDVEFSKTWTTTADENMKLTLPAGTYELTETKAPEGYIKADAITFSVKAEDEVVIVEKKFLRKDKESPVDYIVMTDALKPVPTANVEIARTDGEGNMIAGATLYVKETEGDYFRSWTSEEGKTMELPLLPSTYTITEKATPEGYKTPKTLTFRVKEDLSLWIVKKDDKGEEIEKRVKMVEMAGALKPVPSPTVDVVFVKSDEYGRPVEGAELTVIGKDTDFKESWSTTPLENKTLALSEGTYLLKETKTPENYLTADPITFRVKEDLSLVLVEKDKQRAEIEIPVDYVTMIDIKAPVKYKIIEGAGSTWTKGSGVKHKFVSDAPYGKFAEVKIDRKTVDSRNYTSSEGSTVVVFNAAYMETLATGKHTIEIVSIDGSASANFNVAAKDSPHTGDNSKTALWLILMAVGAAGIATALILIKRRKD